MAIGEGGRGRVVNGGVMVAGHGPERLQREVEVDVGGGSHQLSHS